MTDPIEFPKQTNLNINMMPISIGLEGELGRSLPDHCKQYAEMIINHCVAPSWTLDSEGRFDSFNRIVYLTVQEGFVPVGQSQRRSGLHIERPGAIKAQGTWYAADTRQYDDIAWGLGAWGEDGLPNDGIFMASTVANSCAIWPVLINQPEKVSDKHGGIETMRSLLGQPRLLAANEMCWFTDRTPHESLPLQAPADNPSATHVYRQFFRLVVGPISVWYSKHNTPNPLGILPDCPISDEDKFCDTE